MTRLSLLLVLLCSIAHTTLFSQSCLPNGIHISSQDDIDNFQSDYPNCSEIEGQLFIQGEQITNLHGLSNITHIGGSLTIRFCPNLENLEGLESLQFIGNDCVIRYNGSVTNLNGLQNLTEIGRDLQIFEENINDFQGLNRLKSIGWNLFLYSLPNVSNFSGLDSLAIIGQDLDIDRNENLIDFSGLENLSQLGGLDISRNASLVNFNGLYNVTSLDRDISVYENASLQNFEGLNNIQFLIGEYAGITAKDNAALVNFEGMEKIESIQTLLIENNQSLVSFMGLNALKEIRRIFHVKRNPGLINFEGLSNLNVIQDNWIVEENDSLVNFEGLSDNLVINSEFRVQFNASLQSFEGLDGLAYIHSFFVILDNNDLVNLDGLASLDHVGGISITHNTDLQNLNGLLNHIDTIHGHLSIRENTVLTSISTIPALRKINASLSFGNNDSLSNLNGFNNLQSIGDDFRISNNDALINLTGLDNLEFIGSSLVIDENDMLINFEGLANLETINYAQANNPYYDEAIIIEDNTALENITHLNDVSIDGVEGVTLQNNPKLTTCSSEFLCNYMAFSPNELTITNNGQNCNSELEVAELCDLDLAKLTYSVYWDINENGTQEADEPDLSGQQIQIAPLNVNLYTNTDNSGNYLLEYGDYSVTYISSSEGWELVDESTNFSIPLSETENCAAVAFGVKQIPFSKLTPSVSALQARCNEYITFNVSAKNLGTSTASGALWLAIDENIEEIIYLDGYQPDIIDDNQVAWHFENLTPSQLLNKKVRILIPGPPEFPVGEYINFEVRVVYEDELGEHEKNSPYSTEFRCSWDPNDKQVQPQRENNWTLFEEDLIYTIRFQNTGNAEAYHVSVKDTLDTNLDPRTFKVLDSSHSDKLTTSMTDNRYLSFDFNYIYLPDSTSNPEGSQGYVTYLIETKAGLEDYTNIENTAGIYFDSNPPVITNTVESLMLTEFPTDDMDNDGYGAEVDCNDADPNINQGMPEIPNNDIDEDCDGVVLVIDEDNDGFNSDEDCDDNNADINPDAEEIVNNFVDEDCDGVYIILDEDMDGYFATEDCDDGNPEINPDATEIPNNDIDEDCDGEALVIDDDMDGFNSDEDCDDTNAAINPNGIEIPNNNIDEDCDGEDLISAVWEIEGQQVFIFPNPTTGLLQIRQEGVLQAQLKITSPTGQVLQQHLLPQTTQIDLSDLPNGLYLLSIRKLDGVWTEKIVKF